MGNSQKNIEPGDIVFLKDTNSLLRNWALAIVFGVYPSGDNFVRKVAVEIARTD